MKFQFLVFYHCCSVCICSHKSSYVHQHQWSTCVWCR